MSEEEIKNYPNNSYRTTDDYHKQQQDVVTGDGHLLDGQLLARTITR